MLFLFSPSRPRRISVTLELRELLLLRDRRVVDIDIERELALVSMSSRHMSKTLRMSTWFA
jgi:hypothetical protein